MVKFKHVGVSSMRIYTSKRLRALTEPEIICDHAEPIGAIVPYQRYLQWQSVLQQMTDENVRLRELTQDRYAPTSIRPSEQLPVETCGEIHPTTRARCELHLGHQQNHRGTFDHGIAQWPSPRAERSSS
jgi:hypothetical protein